jgi:hypothetical protein
MEAYLESMLKILKQLGSTTAPTWYMIRTPNGYCTCILCGQPNLNSTTENYHLAEVSHIAKVVEYKRYIQNTQELFGRIIALNSPDMQEILERTNALGSFKWRDNVMSVNALVRFVSAVDESGSNNNTATANANAAATAITTDGNCSAFLAECKEKLVRYEYLEQFALLELAVWKAECIQQMPTASHPRLDVYTAIHWITSGWKTVKMEQRKSSAMSIIVSAVKPFLDERRAVETELETTEA